MEFYAEGSELLGPNHLGSSGDNDESYLDVRSDEVNITHKLKGQKAYEHITSNDDEYTEKADFTTLISLDSEEDMGSAGGVNDILDR